MQKVLMATKYNRYAWVRKLVNQMKNKSMTRTYHIYTLIILTPQPNASIQFLKHRQAYLRITTGLLYNCDLVSLKGTIAHELGHLIAYQTDPNIFSTLDTLRQKSNIEQKTSRKRIHLIKNYLNRCAWYKFFVENLYPIILISLIGLCLLYLIGVINLTLFTSFDLTLFAIVILLLIGVMYSKREVIAYDCFSCKNEYLADELGSELTSNQTEIYSLAQMGRITDEMGASFRENNVANWSTGLERLSDDILRLTDHPLITERVLRLQLENWL